MRICIVNQSDRPDLEVQAAIRSINMQLFDVAYHWSTMAQCRLEGRRYKKRMSLKELRGDALIYLSDEVDSFALGWHEADEYGVPWGVVYTGWDEEPWTVTLSHEVIELLVDPHCNRLARGPHPEENRDVFHWYELCDAVQAITYPIAGIEVSDFLLPGYFTPSEERGMRLSYAGADIPSFGVAPGGYVGFFDPQLGGHNTFAHDGDGYAALQRKLHGRAARYQQIGS